MTVLLLPFYYNRFYALLARKLAVAGLSQSTSFILIVFNIQSWSSLIVSHGSPPQAEGDQASRALLYISDDAGDTIWKASINEGKYHKFELNIFTAQPAIKRWVTPPVYFGACFPLQHWAIPRLGFLDINSRLSSLNDVIPWNNHYSPDCVCKYTNCTKMLASVSTQYK